MFSDIMHGIMITMSPDCLLALCIGAMFGTVVGALPGLGTAVAITICIPFTLQMGNASAIALLLGVYATSIYGGSISAVLLNTPGTPQSACTGFEGYAMAKAGKAEKALGWVTISSVLGGLFSCVALVIAAPQLADLSVKYGGPLEICGLICLGLACITSLSEDNQIKGLLMGVAGLFLATIGVDPLSGEMRFTFGSPQLVSGIDLMPIVVGVFPLAELFYRAYEVHANVEPTAIDCKRISFPTWQEWKGRGLILLRSSLIGVGLGILPGTGATAATFVSYSSAKRLSKNGENFGKGEPDGLVAAESSNNAVAGGAMVPTLALGIPGDPVTAIMLATRDHPRRTAHGGQSRHRLFDLPVPDSRQPFDHPHRHHHRARLREAHQVPHSNPAQHHRHLLPARRVPAPQQHVRRVDGPAHRRDRLPDALCGFPRGPVPHRLRAQRAA